MASWEPALVAAITRAVGGENPKSDSGQHVDDTQRYLTYYYWDYCDNTMNGEEALKSPPYYLYLVRRWAPRSRAAPTV